MHKNEELKENSYKNPKIISGNKTLKSPRAKEVSSFRAVCSWFHLKPLTAHTGATSTAWHPWRPGPLPPSEGACFGQLWLLACKYPALTQRVICSKIKRRETQALGYVKLLSGTDNGKPTLAGRGNLSLQSVRLYVLIRDGALLAL